VGSTLPPRGSRDRPAVDDPACTGEDQIVLDRLDGKRPQGAETFAFSSRTSSGSKRGGGSMAVSARSCIMWF